jgi:hypothetical protein
MKKNVGKIDRGVRVFLGVAIAILLYANKITGPLVYALMVIAGILILTGLIGWCPLYALLGIKKTS